MAATDLKEKVLVSVNYLVVNNQNSGAMAVLTLIMMFNLGDDT